MWLAASNQSALFRCVIVMLLFVTSAPVYSCVFQWHFRATKHIYYFIYLIQSILIPPNRLSCLTDLQPQSVDKIENQNVKKVALDVDFIFRIGIVLLQVRIIICLPWKWWWPRAKGKNQQISPVLMECLRLIKKPN